MKTNKNPLYALRGLTRARRARPATFHPPPATVPPTRLQPSAFSLQPSPRTRGAALLIVIGLLALLLISSVAFSILMTVERSAAGNYRHAVQARQLLYAGLAQAIADIDAEPSPTSLRGVGENIYPPWTNAVIKIGSRNITCMAEVMQSIDYTRTTTNAACAARVLSAAAMNYIPRSLWQAAQTVTPEAIPFTVSVNGQPNAIGRYAYVAVNVSGLLDANCVCTTSRWLGANSGEIQIADGFPFDVVHALGVNAFIYDRTNLDQRYESIAELSQLEGVQAGNITNLSNFETYSYAPTPELQTNGITPKVFIGYDPTFPGTAVQQLQAQQPAISNAFYQCFAGSTPMPGTNVTTATSAQWAYESLIDYVNPIPVPDGCDKAAANIQTELARPASKNAPMIESVALAMTYNWTFLSATTFSYSVSYMPVVSCARPFAGPSPAATYTVTLNFFAAPSSDASLSKYKVLLPATLPAQPASVSFPANTYNSSRFVSFPVVTTPTLILTNTVAKFLQPTNACMLAFAVRITDASGNIVDQVPAGTTSKFGSGFTDSTHYIVLYYRHACGGTPLPTYPGPSYPSPVNSENHVVWAEAIDPAINWDGMTDLSGSGQWIASETDPTGSGNGDPDTPPRFALTNLITTFSSFFSPGTTSGVTRSTSACQTWSSKVQLNPYGGLLSSCLLTNGNNSSMLDWWNRNAKSKWGVGNFAPCMIPDGLTLGSSTADSLNNCQIRHYVKGGAITNVGELGYLQIGPWMTFNLYPHGHNSAVTNTIALQMNNVTMLPQWQYHRLLDYFTVRPTNTASVVRGLVNLAASNQNVHACVFYQMPINEFDLGKQAVNTVNNQSDAITLAKLMTANSCVFTNLSDMGLILSGAQTNGIFSSITSFPSATTGEFERKAVIRNAAGLYTTRQQLYTIIVRADAMSQEYGGVTQGQGDSGNPAKNGSVLGSAQAVFQVWRDPAYPDGTHHCFIRLCKILSL